MSKPRDKGKEKDSGATEATLGTHLTEKGGAKVSRRTVLKAGVAAGVAATVLTSKKSSVWAQTTITPPVECGTTNPNSPPTTPFLDNLPVPQPAIPSFLHPAPTEAANIAGGEAPRDDHQRWDEFPAILQYLQTAAPSLNTLHHDFSPTYLWTFNGVLPAQTILNVYGLASLVRFNNQLPATDPGNATTGFGNNELTIHLHNSHTASESDGFAGDYVGFDPGFFKDNHYANRYAGIDEFGGLGDQREAMHTFWFHDHHAAFTDPNNYLGLNGMYIVYDNIDPGHEFHTPGSLQLPGYYGVTDFPLELTDKRFCATANGRTEQFLVPGKAAPGGDKWLINGKIQPKLSVRRRKYRFRILNTGPAKQWNLGLIGPDGNPASMTVVAVDANFLHQPYDTSTQTVNVAQRYDVIIDFSRFSVGQSVYLTEAAPQNVGVTYTNLPPNLAIENVVMRFDVIDGIFLPDTPPIPDTLVDLPDLPTPTATMEWRFTLDPTNPTSGGHAFLINSLPFDANRVDHAILQGTSEEWTIRNDVLAGAWLHPVHIHFEEGRVMQRTVRASLTDPPVPVTLTPDEDFNNARRDVYPIPTLNAVTMRLRFRDFLGRYLIHCHNMAHEDNYMMTRWDIVSSISELHRRRQDIAEYRRAKGVPVEEGLPKEVLS
ncbi:MAG: multicopper oxidase family protein [Blastocatellia bacterium]